jgi:hypothetical protein
MTLNKRYVWSVEKPPDKMVFLAYVVDVRVHKSHLVILLNPSTDLLYSSYVGLSTLLKSSTKFNQH